MTTAPAARRHAVDLALPCAGQADVGLVRLPARRSGTARSPQPDRLTA